MGEVLNNLIRFVTIIGYFILVFSGVYLGLASIGTDVMQDSYKKAYQRGDKSASVPFFDIQKNRISYTFIFAAHPKMWVKVMGKIFPPINDLSQLSKGNYVKPEYLKPERVTWHFAPWLFGFALFALLFEFLVYPFVRTRVARWLAEDRTQIFGSIKDLPSGDGFVLAHDVRLARNGGGNPHVLTIGPSGNGKSACQVLPSLLQLPDDCALVVTDPKAELLARATPYLQSRGHKIIVLGPLTGYGHGWDPLRECASADDVRELARQLIAAGDESQGNGSASNWNNMSRTCLSSYLLQAHADGLGLAHGLRALYADEASGELIVDDAARLDYRLFESMSGSGATVGSIMATIQGACSIWLSDKVVGFMAHQPAFSMSDIRSKKAAVFLVSSASDSKAIRPFQWLFFTRLFAHLAEGGTTDVRLILDEMANLGALEGIDQALNLLRGAGVQMHGFVQNLSQLKSVYGKDIGDVVAESFGTVSIMSGLRQDAKALSELLGLQGVVRANYSTQDEKMRAQFSENDKSALDGSLLRQISRNEVLIISGNHKPIFAHLKPWFRVPGLKNRVQKPFRADWGLIPDNVKAAFFKKFKAIKPVAVVLPKKEKSEAKGKLKRKKSASSGEPPEEVLDSWFDQVNEEEKHENTI